jgi:hypothetical protein
VGESDPGGERCPDADGSRRLTIGHKVDNATYPNAPVCRRPEVKPKEASPILVRLSVTLPVIATYACVWKYNHGYIAG